MKTTICTTALLLSAGFLGVTARAQQANSTTLAPNQTFGYGDDQVLVFSYGQSFVCVDEPTFDLNFNGVKAASDPSEFQIPICQVGIQPTVGPSGPAAQGPAEPVYILIPMFSVDNDQNPNDAISCTDVVPGTNCGQALGSALISLFGALPEAFKAKPLVYTQCPDPNSPPGACTMHASRVDLGLALEKLGLLPPPPANFFVPAPNHSHVVPSSGLNTSPIWWEVVPVLVLNPAQWPSQDGANGITSKAKLVAAEQAGQAKQLPSNFFLFFSSNTMSQHVHTMH